jgi:hypothetical protein
MKPAMTLALIAALAVGCTGSKPSSNDEPSSKSALPRHVTVQGRVFDVSCTPVAEALVDITLRHDQGQPMTRAITGLWDHQAVAVLANDRQGCGVWALGIARGLSQNTAEAIRQEVADGVKNFGVTASPVPRNPGSG